MKKMWWVGLGMLIAALMPALALNSQSLDDVGLAVRPAILEIASQPGETHTVNVAIENTSLNPLPVIIDSRTLIPIDDEIDKSRRDEFDASRWVKIEEPNQVFAPGDVKEFEFEVVIPKEASPGGHYALISIRALSEQVQTENSNALIVPEIGVSLFITVAGDINEQAGIEASNLISERITKNDVIPLEFTVRNVGNVHILPSPRISILKDGKQIESFNLNPQLILPNTEKRFVVEWSADVGYGQYQAQAELIYGNASIPLASEPINFQVWPPIWQIIVVSSLAILLLVIIFRWRNIPRTVAVLRGRAAGVKKKYKQAPGNEELPDQEKAPDYDDLGADIDGKARKAAVFGLPAAKAASKKTTTKESKTEDTETKTSQKKSVAKAIPAVDQEESIAETELKAGASVTEMKDGDGPTKTVIIQTSSSTIVREEADDTKAKKAEGKARKISVKDDSGATTATKKTKTTTKKGSPKKKTPAKKSASKSKSKQKSSSAKSSDNAPTKKKTAKKTSSKAKKKSTTNQKTKKPSNPKKKQGSTSKKKSNNKKSK